MMSHGATMAVAALFGEQESTEQVNCIVSSMHQAGPLYPRMCCKTRPMGVRPTEMGNNKSARAVS